MTLPTIAFVIGLVLALIDEFQAHGRSFVGWAVVAVCIGLLWGHLG